MKKGYRVLTAFLALLLLLTPVFTVTSAAASGYYTVKWYNGNTALKFADYVKEGETADYKTYLYGTPSKAADENGSYTFIGFNTDPNATTALPLPVSADGKTYYSLPVTAPVTYYAIFKSNVVTKTVTWHNGLRVVKTDTVNQGSTATYSVAESGTPAPATLGLLDYEFVGWSLNPLAYKAELTSTDGVYTTAPVKTNLHYYAVYKVGNTVSADLSTLTGKVTEKVTEKVAEVIGDITKGEGSLLPTLPTTPSLPTVPTLPTVNVKRYTVHWLNYNGTSLHEDVNEIAEGDEAWYVMALNGVPTRPDDDDYTYKFIGFNKDKDATENALKFNSIYYATEPIYEESTYYAIYEAIAKTSPTPPVTSDKHTVHWLNYDGSVLHDDINEIKDGDSAWYIVPFNGTPERPDDENYTYDFIGWNTDPLATEPLTLAYNGIVYESDPIYEDTTFYAIYRASAKPVKTNKYLITWMNGGLLLSADLVSEGEVPEYSSFLFGTPDKLPDDDFTYEFAGWSPVKGATEPVEITPASGHTTYYAVFTATERKKYTVTWKNYDGEVLHTDKEEIHEGSNAVYSVALCGIPTRESDKVNNYVFVGFNTDKDASDTLPLVNLAGVYYSEDITEDTTYYAIYKAVPIVYTVTWSVDGKLYLDFYKYGETPEFKHDLKKQSDKYGEYEFAGWDKAIEPVSGNVMYTALFHLKPSGSVSPKTGYGNFLFSFAVIIAACAAYSVYGSKQNLDIEE